VVGGTRPIARDPVASHQKRGATVCNNALVLPVDRVDAAVVTAFLTEVLRPKVVSAILDAVFDGIQASTAPTNINSLKRDLGVLEKKITNLTDAVESGAAIAPLVKKLHERQAERGSVAGGHRLGRRRVSWSIRVMKEPLQRSRDHPFDSPAVSHG